jgi:acyl-CoA synthetase (NDP forming)
MADVFTRAGFTLPQLSLKSLQELETFFSAVGGSYRNPVEGIAMREPDTYARALRIVLADENVDAVAIELPAKQLRDDADLLAARIELLRSCQAATSKPLVAVVTTTLPYLPAVPEPVRECLLSTGQAFCAGFEAAALALRNVVDRHYFGRFTPLGSSAAPLG